MARYKSVDRLPTTGLRVRTTSPAFLNQDESRRVEGSTYAAMGGTRAGFPAGQAELAVHTLHDVSVVWNVFNPEAGDAGEVAANSRWRGVDDIPSTEVVMPGV
jgi:hypothetical protein